MFTLSYIMLKGFIFKKAHQRHSSHKDRHTIKSVSVVLRCFLFLHKNIYNLNITYRKPGCVILRCLCTVLYLQKNVDQKKTSTYKRNIFNKDRDTIKIISEVFRCFPFLHRSLFMLFQNVLPTYKMKKERHVFTVKRLNLRHSPNTKTN